LLASHGGSIAINLERAETMQFGSLGLPLKNVTIRIRDDAGRDLPDDESGQIWVKSPFPCSMGAARRHGD